MLQRPPDRVPTCLTYYSFVCCVDILTYCSLYKRHNITRRILCSSHARYSIQVERAVVKSFVSPSFIAFRPSNSDGKGQTPMSPDDGRENRMLYIIFDSQ